MDLQKEENMTREEAKELIPIIQAFADGKTIEFFKQGVWIELNDPDFMWSADKYRIKPEPKYRPFKNREECWEEMLKHQPFGWIKEKHSNRYNLITEVNGLSIKVKEGCLFTDDIKYYTFADGTPFGIKIEE